MRVIHIYLMIYFLLIAGAAVVLWNAGVAQRIPSLWLLIGASGAVLLGVLLAVLSASPRRVRNV